MFLVVFLRAALSKGTRCLLHTMIQDVLHLQGNSKATRCKCWTSSISFTRLMFKSQTSSSLSNRRHTPSTAKQQPLDLRSCCSSEDPLRLHKQVHSHRLPYNQPALKAVFTVCPLKMFFSPVWIFHNKRAAAVKVWLL